MRHLPALTLDQVLALDVDAYHESTDGSVYLWREGCCVRTSADRKVTVVVRGRVPTWPWFRYSDG